MKEVTKEQFYGIIHDQKLDVMPHSRLDFNEPVRVTDWHNRDRSTFGISEVHTTDANGAHIYPHIEKYYINL